MAQDVKLPRLGQGMETGTIVRWLKAEGDTVEKGEPLFEVDTDKATQEVEAETSGVLLAISVSSGEVPVGETVAVIGEAGEQVSAPAGNTPDEPRADEPPAEPAAVEPAAVEPAAVEPAAVEPAAVEPAAVEPAAVEPAPSEQPLGDATPAAEARASAPPASEPPASEPARAGVTFRDAVNGARDRIKASPLARRIAQERGIELTELTGTGPDGRIVAEDVERAEVSAPPRPSAEPATREHVESVPLTKIRATIARRLTAAWEVPVFQLTVSVDMTDANTLIARSRELTPDVRITVTDLLVKVCARALVRHPDVNVQYTEEALLRFPSANIGIAVAAPQGLVVPVVHGAERLSLAEIAARRDELVARARNADDQAQGLKLQDLEGGTFTISNLGMFGVEQFSAVLNPPQAAILAVGATVDRPVAHNGEIVVRPMMNATLTVDHRAVDGAPAADFLRTVKFFLEDPALAL